MLAFERPGGIDPAQCACAQPVATIHAEMGCQPSQEVS
jgi:hypothetical protein